MSWIPQSVVVVVQADRFLTFISPTENDVLVPVLARSIDVVVVSFVVDLKLPNERRLRNWIILWCLLYFAALVASAVSAARGI